jgi:hypothetical protein
VGGAWLLRSEHKWGVAMKVEQACDLQERSTFCTATKCAPRVHVHACEVHCLYSSAVVNTQSDASRGEYDIPDERAHHVSDDDKV